MNETRTGQLAIISAYRLALFVFLLPGRSGVARLGGPIILQRGAPVHCDISGRGFSRVGEASERSWSRVG